MNNGKECLYVEYHGFVGQQYVRFFILKPVLNFSAIEKALEGDEKNNICICHT